MRNTPIMSKRLDQYVSKRTALSRKQVKQAARQGELSVNGTPEKDTARKISAEDRVVFQGQVLEFDATEHEYWMLHKPEGCVCSTHDLNNPSALAWVEEVRYEQQGIMAEKRPLQMVGRLDKDTTGLLLLTTDGQWNHRITSPRSHCKKVYRVGTFDPITPDACEQLTQGVLLEDDPTPTLPAEVEVLTEKCLRLTLQEGRYHQVKRMLAAVGNHVVTLHREQIGELPLDNALESGECRRLTDDEVALFSTVSQ